MDESKWYKAGAEMRKQLEPELKRRAEQRAKIQAAGDIGATVAGSVGRTYLTHKLGDKEQPVDRLGRAGGGLVARWKKLKPYRAKGNITPNDPPMPMRRGGGAT